MCRFFNINENSKERRGQTGWPGPKPKAILMWASALPVKSSLAVQVTPLQNATMRLLNSPRLLECALTSDEKGSSFIRRSFCYLNMSALAQNPARCSYAISRSKSQSTASYSNDLFLKGPYIGCFSYDDPDILVAFPYEEANPHAPIPKARLKKESPFLFGIMKIQRAASAANRL